VSDERGLRRSWPEDGPRRLWNIDGLGMGWSSPIIVEDAIYITGDVGDELVIFAFDLDGRPQWRTTNGKRWVRPYPGARATCAYSDGRVYNMNAHGRVVCVDARTGDEIWAVDILDRFEAENITWALSECLLVDGNRVIVTPGGRKALVAALDKRTGETVWTTPPLGDDKTSHSSPILFRHAGRRLIANCSSAHGFGVDADTGELLWTVALKNPHGVNASTPVYDSGRVYYVTARSQMGRQYELRAGPDGVTADHVWTSPLDSVTGGAVLAEGTLFAATYLKPKRWLAVDWDTGRTKHEQRELTTGAAIYAGGRLYCLDERGNVALVDPVDLTIVSRFKLVAGNVRDAWAHPVLLDGRLYLRYHDTLTCFDVTAP
jgi:outer membrane protein assembly factor BamB